MLDKLYFKLRIFEKHGTNFQSFFANIMFYSNDDFIPVDGATGDGGNDGYIPSQRHYFQVYAPSRADINGSFFSNSVNYATNKLEKDFEKLLNSDWCKGNSIEHYTFVMNDRFEGQPPQVGQKLLEMKERYPGVIFDYCGAHYLHKIFMQCNKNTKEIVVDFPTFNTVDVDYFDSDALGKVIGYILEKCSKSLPFGSNKPIAPTFDTKLKFNNLCEQFQHELKLYSYQINMIDDFLNNNPKDAVKIQAVLSAIYRESKEIIIDTELERSDIIYIRLYENMIPEELKRDASSCIGYIQAAKILLAKYFEACDVFEDPDKSGVQDDLSICIDPKQAYKV